MNNLSLERTMIGNTLPHIRFGICAGIAEGENSP